MGYKKIGLAFCRGLRKEARVVADLFTAQGFDVVSVICKTGGFPKESVGIPKEKKVNADAFEPMCNPIAQAEFLNSQETEFNIALGLCVGHDSMFYKYSKQMVTTLVAKERGCLAKGGEADTARAAGLLLDDFRSGRLGRITLEFPEPEKEVQHGE